MNNAVARIIAAVVGHEDGSRLVNNWVSVPRWLRAYEDDLAREWTPERDGFADMMAEDADRPSGISGIDPSYFRVKAHLVFRGRQAIEIAQKKGLR